MQDTTGTRIQIPSSAKPGELFRTAIVTGSQEGCAKVQQMIHTIIAEQSSSSVMSGAPIGGYTQQHYGQQDGQYSAEWAAYHAAQAAVAQQQQSAPQAVAPMQTAAAPAAAAAAAPGADAYYEQFFRYSYYYGEAAARQYYGAWSPPEGTPNPYGINPNGIQPAPAPTPAAAAAPAQSYAPAAAATAPSTSVAAAVTSEIRDTGRRKVSNLPAWMTKK